MNTCFRFILLTCCFLFANFGSVALADKAAPPNSTPGHAQTVNHAANATTNPSVGMIPIPEPSTGSLVLLSLGAFGLALKLRRKA